MKKKKRKRSRLIEKILLFIFSILLIPFAVSLLFSFPVLFSAYSSIAPGMVFAAGGFLLFSILFAFAGPPARSYILEHELSHVVFALLSGVKVKRASVRSDGGSVETERVNLIITLAPYAFPMYSFICAGAYRILRLFSGSGIAAALFFGTFGASLSFHIITTIHYLQIEQPDLKRYGAFASLIIIFTLALMILALLFGLIFEKVKVFEYISASLSETFSLYGRLYSFLLALKRN